MKPVRFALGATAFALATSAFAVPQTGTYTFASPTGTTGTSSWLATPNGYNATSGSDYGNSITFGSSGFSIPVTATAWASTGGVGGYGGTLQSGYVSRYSNNGSMLNELAITSRPGAGNTSELVYNSYGTATPNSASGAPQHAIDNLGAYESMLFSFGSAVALNKISVGFPSRTSALDSDATVLVYTGSGDPTGSLSTHTYSNLLSSGWIIAGNLSNLAASGSGTLLPSVSSKYWMVGAYMNIGTNGAAMINDGFDYLKLSGLTVTTGLVPPLLVPEPAGIALFGVAAAAMLAARRRRASKA